MSITREMNVHTRNDNLVIKKKTFESVLMRWMTLEPIIQSEVSLNRVQLLVTPWAARLLCARDFPGKNTGVGCHFLLQCVKVKSESEVA